VLPKNSKIHHPAQNQNSNIRYLYKPAPQNKLNAKPNIPNPAEMQLEKYAKIITVSLKHV